MGGPELDLQKLTASPDGKIAIRANGERTDDDFHFDFYEVGSGKSLGKIEAAKAVSKVAFVCRWNPDGSRVAVLMFYGTKLSSLLVFQKAEDGRFVELDFQIPDAFDAYAKAKRQPAIPKDHHGGSLNGLGKWNGRDSVHLICGEWLEGEQVDALGSNLVVSFDVKIAEGKATVENVKAHELMNDAATEAFFKANGVITGDDGS